MILIGDVLNLKIGVARTLICIGSATGPLCESDIWRKVATDYDKLYPELHFKRFMIQLRATYKWITNECALTKEGQRAYVMLVAHKDLGAAEFFRKSNTPNFGPRAQQVAPGRHIDPCVMAGDTQPHGAYLVTV